MPPVRVLVLGLLVALVAVPGTVVAAGEEGDGECEIVPDWCRPPRTGLVVDVCGDVFSACLG